MAKDIAAGLQEVQIFSIAQAIDGQIDLDADNIGLVFPVFYAGIPRIVCEFIKKLDPEKINYLVAVCTCGSFAAGALKETEKQLKAKGIGLNVGYALQMPGNYIVKYGAIKKEKQEKLFRNEKETVKRIVRDIENHKNSPQKRGGLLINKIGESIYRSKLQQFSTLDKNFTLNGKCNGCGICERICPVRNIMIADYRPRWQGNCEHCMACLQWCPREAIEYSRRTAGRKRYRHPDVRTEELFVE